MTTIYTITCYKLVQQYMMYNADREAVIVQKTQSHWTIIDSVSVLVRNEKNYK